MTLDITNLPIILARDFKHIEGRRTIRNGVIHDVEAARTHETAENIGRYFQHPDRPSSCHLIFDDDSCVRSVLDNDVAYAAPGANHDGLQYELAGYGRQTREEWLDPYGRRMLALVIAAATQHSRLYGLPPRHLSVSELIAGQKGWVGHVDVTNAYHQSDHTDPGEGFPWDVFVVGLAASLHDPQPAPPPPAPSSPSVGARRWSNYFKRWIILVRYQDDDNWWFTDGSGMTTTKAQSKWSVMPLNPSA